MSARPSACSACLPSPPPVRPPAYTPAACPPTRPESHSLSLTAPVACVFSLTLSCTCSAGLSPTRPSNRPRDRPFVYALTGLRTHILARGPTDLLCTRRAEPVPAIAGVSRDVAFLCDLREALGYSGEKNWQQHENGKEHQKKQGSTGKNLKVRSITSFFAVRPAGPVAGLAADVPAPLPLRAASLQRRPRLFTKMLFAAMIMQCVIIIDSDSDDAPIPEPLCAVLNGFLGYGATDETIAALIRRGPLGIDGLCGWLKWPDIPTDRTQRSVADALLLGVSARRWPPRSTIARPLSHGKRPPR
ncbi:uncharacterized protein B0H18DRAFT_1113866 [Fomitopsis serialis]|nr:uncharacterized protein B0H18DRAFT_1113866 [Neoantrodia serialis]KAH9936482.1 hypothetical protein B0H18DRAFT_1113866 [Neoantrodia serialis]